jgi:TolA-binding protein
MKRERWAIVSLVALALAAWALSRTPTENRRDRVPETAATATATQQATTLPRESADSAASEQDLAAKEQLAELGARIDRMEQQLNRLTQRTDRVEFLLLELQSEREKSQVQSGMDELGDLMLEGGSDVTSPAQMPNLEGE